MHGTSISKVNIEHGISTAIKFEEDDRSPVTFMTIMLVRDSSLLFDPLLRLAVSRTYLCHY